MLVLQGRTYHFRRRVPDRLRAVIGKAELWHSLNTTSRQIAKARAAAVYLASDRVFMEATDMRGEFPALDGEGLLYLTHSLRNTCRRIAAGTDDGSLCLADIEEGLRALEAELASEKDKLRRARDRLDEATALADDLPQAERLHDLAARLDALVPATMVDAPGVDIGTIPPPVPSPRPAELDPYILAVIRETVLGLRQDMAATLQGALPSTRAETAIKPPAPLFSELQQAFMTDMVTPPDKDTPARWTIRTRDENARALSVFLNLVGDRPIDQYTRMDAGQFYNDARLLPFSHGKARNGETPKDAIARADAEEETGKIVHRVKLRTVERYFHTLSPYWKWLKPRGHVAENIFTEFEFHGTKANAKKARDLWAAEDLTKLFKFWWFRSSALRDKASFWLPLIAMFSGMRLEEIGHLRPCDIKQEGEIWYFDLCDHPEDGWSPKTEAGARRVPIHSFLIRLGLLNLVERRRAAGAPFVFTDLKADGYGARTRGFSRDFSKKKVSLGVNEKTVFHSFRHNVRTQLEDVDVHERWIDGVIGHTRKEASEGQRTYNKGIGLKRAQEVIESIKPEIDLSHLF